MTTFVEPEHFAGLELFILFNTCFWISVIIHLHHIRNKQKKMQTEFTQYCSIMLNAMQGLRDLNNNIHEEEK